MLSFEELQACNDADILLMDEAYSTDAVWWTGSKYDGLCYIACDGWGDPYKSTGEEAGYTAMEMKTRDELRQRRWCEANSAN